MNLPKVLADVISSLRRGKCYNREIYYKIILGRYILIQIILYLSAIVLTMVSFFKDKDKTKMALKKSIKSFENILPTLLCVMITIGILLSLIDNETIVKFLGASSGIKGVIIAALLGSITMMAGFIAFPLGATLLQSGAGVAQVAALISTIMMVGILTIPMEEKYWGRKATLLRNGLGFIFSIIAALIIGVVCS